MTRLTIGLTLAAALAAGAATAQDRSIRIAPAAPPAHPANGVLYTKFAEYLAEESGGRLGSTMIGPEVVNLGQMKDALQSQVTEVGNLLPLYFPADLPITVLPGELSLQGTDSQATAAAMTEYLVTCAPCQEEMRAFGIVYLGSGASDIYEILSTKPVRTADDMKGLRLRSGGSPWGRLAEHFGAVPAQMSVFDQFESISQGVIDGTMASIADLLSFRLVEVVGYVTELPIGNYFSTVDFAVANTTWDSLSPEDREAMVRAANRANADFTQRWGTEMPEEAEAAAREAGLEFVEPDPSLVSAIEEFIAADVDSVKSIGADQSGIADAGEQVDRFMGLLDKWNGISAELGGDPAAMAERVQSEVWDTIDVATYGAAN